MGLGYSPPPPLLWSCLYPHGLTGALYYPSLTDLHTYTTQGSRVNNKVMNALVVGTAGYTHGNIDESNDVEKGSELEELAAEDFDAL